MDLLCSLNYAHSLTNLTQFKDFVKKIQNSRRFRIHGVHVGDSKLYLTPVAPATH